MEVIIILDSPDSETYVVAIVAIPKGKTADEAFDQWKAQAIAESQIEHAFTPEEAADAAAGYYYEEESVVVLPSLVAGLPIENIGSTFADLIGDSGINFADQASDDE